MWGESENERKINWIHWENVCRTLDEWGLGVRNFKVFNKALLGKWKWKIKSERGGLWYNALINKYGRLEDLSGIYSRRGFKLWNDVRGIEIGEWEMLVSFLLNMHIGIFFLL